MLSRIIAGQLAQPHGIVGRLVGAAMDVANGAPTRMAVDLLAPEAGERVLDAGCGTGAGMAELLKRADCRIAGVDGSEVMIRRATSRLSASRWVGSSELHRVALENLPFQSDSFDAALALNMLYFCGPDAGMVAELQRVLKPGGRLVAYVTHRQSMENWSFTRAGRHRLFDERELVALLAAGGFDPDQIRIQTKFVARRVSGIFARARA